MKQIERAADLILTELERAIHGKRSVLRMALTCLLAEGHLLLQDLPGTGKTLLCKALARVLGGSFKRIQGTPDLLPGDVTGSSVWNPKDGAFVFLPGPVFCNVLLMDEINRATPRAQAALLECMGEGQVSVEGQTYAVPAPFFVIATQNPVEFEGTFPLPEAQLDRFLMQLQLGYPSQRDEEEMLVRRERETPLDAVRRVLSGEQLLLVQRAIRQIFVHPSVRGYLVRLVSATRKHKDLVLGAGPRATLGLYRAAQALAAISGREHVLPDDIRVLAPVVLCHRFVLGADGRLSGRGAAEVLEEVISQVPAPVEIEVGGLAAPAATVTGQAT